MPRQHQETRPHRSVTLLEAIRRSKQEIDLLSKTPQVLVATNLQWTKVIRNVSSVALLKKTQSDQRKQPSHIPAEKPTRTSGTRPPVIATRSVPLQPESPSKAQREGILSPDTGSINRRNPTPSIKGSDNHVAQSIISSRKTNPNPHTHLTHEKHFVHIY